MRSQAIDLILPFALAVSVMTAAVSPARTVDRVIAKVNEDVLTETDLADLGESNGPGGRVDMNSLTPEIVGTLLDRALLLQAAKKYDIKVPDTDIHNRVDQIVADVRKRYPSEKAFRQDLADAGMSLERFKRDIAKQAATDYKISQAVSRRFLIADADVARYEQECRAKGRSTASYHLRQLAFPVEGESKDAESAALDKVREAYQSIQTGGLSFAEGVRRFSPDPQDKESGGDLGYLPSEKLAPKVLAAVKDLEPGHASRPLLTGARASVFYVENKRGVRDLLFEEKFFEQKKQLLGELRRSAHLQIYDPRLRRNLPKEYRDRVEYSVDSTAKPTRKTRATPTPTPTPTPKPKLFGIFPRGGGS